jgi:hypothetical protein
MSSLRKIQRTMGRNTEEEQGDHQKLPTGMIKSSPVKGEFLALPLFGWVGVRKKLGTPLVMLMTLLMRSAEDTHPRGTLQIELPVWPETELATLDALIRFGWDGRVWPKDEGWPAGTPDEEMVTALLTQSNLKATLTFPSGEKGASAQPVVVSRARGPFLMPPLPEPVNPVDPAKLEYLRMLCQNPELFWASTQ